MISTNITKSLPDGWRVARFDEFLTRTERKFIISDDDSYDCVGVRWYGLGAFIRERQLGANIARKQQWIIKAGDVIYNKLFAWKGAFAIADEKTDGCIVSDKFPTYNIDTNQVIPEYLKYYFLTDNLARQAQYLSKGAAAISKLTLNPPQFWDMLIPLPSLPEQQRIVARVEALARRVEEARGLRREAVVGIWSMLLEAYSRITEGAQHLPLKQVAPQVRRPVAINLAHEYPELGIRSFGKGTFHKPAISGASLGSKRVFEIEPGDLIFSNVFAWEGAVAVVKPEDKGRVGSHRFITCVPKAGLATAPFLCFHFCTEAGLRQLDDASPGGAGRNRTLGLTALANIPVPVPRIEHQCWFDLLQERTIAIKHLQAEADRELDALMPSILARAFAGEL